MANTLLNLVAKEDMPEPLQGMREHVKSVTGDTIILQAFANSNRIIDFFLTDFYQKIFLKVM